MNTSKLQAFATDARRQLMNAVQTRLDAALVPNSDAQVDDPRAFAFLKREIEQAGGSEQGRKHVVERYSYRWFNRIIAFRYMDVHGFTGTPVVSPAGLTSTNGLPEVLAAAKRGEYDSRVFSLQANDKAKERIEGLLSGSILADDPQGLAYGLLLQSECRFWNRNLPFMFENVGKEAGRVDELLMPADLLAEGSVLRNAVEIMTPEDCGVDDPSGNVEIIGWLYQYYISERKNEVMDGFKKNHKAGAEEIPAATQLFTPDWIVRYLVQNTVGRLWMQSHPDSQLYKNWDYYIWPSENDAAGDEDILKIQTPEDLTVCDPACGSGHMLTYAFDLLYEIYEEEGYAPSDIPSLILKYNLYGMEIDERAASLAAFALTMKARSRSRRFFKKQVEPNIQRIAPIPFEEGDVADLNDLYQVDLDFTVWNTYAKADVYGSLIQPPQELVDLAASAEDTEAETTLFDSLLRERVEEVFVQTRYLARKYAAVVANPPYMGAKNMSGELKQFVQDHYEDGKADLFAAFIYRLLGMVPEHGQLGFMTPYVWMFISSYEQMRQHIIRQEHISSLIQLEYSGFEGATVPICTFTLEKGHSDRKSAFVRLSDFVGAKQQGPRALGIIDAHNNEQSAHSGMRKYFFEVNQHEFAQIPGSPIVYWLGEQLRKTLINPASDTILFSDGLIKTGDNLQYLRLWWELISTDVNNKSRYRFCAKGGKERNYYGNLNNVVKWDEETRDYYRSDKVARISPKYLWDKEGITWTKISSRGGTFRLLRKEDIAETGGPSLFLKDNVDGNDLLSFIGVITSSLAPYILQGLNPTLNYQTGDVLRFPLPIKKEEALPSLVHSMIGSSKEDWDSFETSWDFQRFALLDPNQGSQAGDLLEDAVTHLREYWNRVSEEQRQREIRNNELVADAYGVRDDVPCDVPLERVSLKRNVAFAYPKDTPEARNEKFAQDVVRELISYAVGCMFGRYSLNKPGLILASQGETLDDFHAQIPNPSFEPDVDNVIPVTETDCFEDDIVTRFRRFLSVVFGKENLAANIAYIEQVLGKSIRKYFVNDFYNDHVKMYSNRPIYWQYSSQTNNKGSFKALVYLHRYTPKTTNVVLNYLRDYTGKIADIADGLERSDRTADKKQAAKLRKVVLECKDYEDQTLYPLATRNLEIDLDDGVLVNYLRMGKALRSIPAIEKKRKEVSTWTWPVHPLGKE
ncbi:BREX-1 system adenine-specific DNA-methyltransferase PglX [Bifidobacterium adolescentis]|uniref:BREX-1 system adenine-specific DNA-methyltransferase PglX n=1 Tax=Bifidobacterium adolescentis TaxID=1680 RepID=UPI0018970BC1|nr:BREX-1 system adenine-specific DNA-methyltransferase PglX [Bifidobacterium adolescentis]MDB1475038.1 BREX-1 system adenine-specific DNA-methyltransferase PglX [Bifidobacterium adolescentis]MDB1488714.1 BREX-1 system adenine-specific DNA-methyltransferase PglX [Bifidobacterium adolescentis]